MIIYPNSRIVLKESFDKHTSSLIKNVALANWKTVANIVFKHANIREHIPKCVEREVSVEFHSLSSDNILSWSTPEELAASSNKIFLHEVNVKFLLRSASVNRACGSSPQDQKSPSKNRANRVMNAKA